jgi:hypothetical protein
MSRKRTQDEIDLMPTFWSCMHLYSWQNLSPHLHYNFSKMKKLLGILRRTQENIKRFGETQNIEVKEFIDANPLLYDVLVKKVSVLQIYYDGGYDKEDVEVAMDCYIEQYDKGLQYLDPTILRHIAVAFKQYRSPDNKKSLDQIFKQKDYKKETKDPFTIPEDIRKFALKLIETKGITKKVAVDSMGKGSYDYYIDNFEKYKWDILSDYLFDKCIVGKTPTAPIPTYRKNITKFWDGIVLPERNEFVESLLPDDTDFMTVRDNLRNLR